MRPQLQARLPLVPPHPVDFPRRYLATRISTRATRVAVLAERLLLPQTQLGRRHFWPLRSLFDGGLSCGGSTEPRISSVLGILTRFGTHVLGHVGCAISR